MSIAQPVAVTKPIARSVHWPEALMEALALGLFMISAGIFGTLFEYPGSPVREAITSSLARRVLMGVAMGLTAIGLVYSPWGKRSGAHMNPAFTITQWRLGRVKGGDALAYVAMQFAGGLAGALVVVSLLGEAFRAPPVAAVATLPGETGVAVAFVCEFAISFALVSMVLILGTSRWAERTGLSVGGLVCLYIVFEAPYSGMSMNPARSLASAIPAGLGRGLWIYFTAPLAGMLLAAETHVRLVRSKRAGCAKIVHSLPCIFCGGQPPQKMEPAQPPVSNPGYSVMPPST
jgi:aquaporin Z